MKNKHKDAILAKVLEMTKARVVAPTAEEARQLRELEEQDVRSREDRARMAVVMEELRREKAMIEKARGPVKA